jgi:hypothetical protein
MRYSSDDVLTDIPTPTAAKTPLNCSELVSSSAQPLLSEGSHNNTTSNIKWHTPSIPFLAPKHPQF